MADNLDPSMYSPEFGTAAKLTEWENEPTVLLLKEELDIAKQSHDDHVSQVKSWLDLRNVTGSVKPKTGENRSSVQPKLVRRQAEWRYSALSEPFHTAKEMFSVQPKTWEDTRAAEQNTLVLNYQFRTKLNRVRFIDEFTRTSVDEGTCVVRLGWLRETEFVEEEVTTWQYEEVVDQVTLDALQQAMALRTENPNEFLNLPPDLQESVKYSMETSTPAMAVAVSSEMAEVEKVRKNQPTLDIINFENFYLDPSCEGDLDKAAFAVISFETSKAELLKDGRYTNLEKVNWSSNTPLTDADHSTMTDNSVEFKDDLRKRVIAYEYWGWYDIYNDDTLVPICATWIGDTMIRMEENPFPDQKLPFVVVPYLPVKRSITGEPDAELLAENQAILGAVTRGMIDLMGRSANGQTGFAKGMLDVVNRRRYDSGADYEFNPNMPPASGILQHKYPEIPASALNMLQLQNQEAEALSGVKAFSGGLSGESYGNVATGIRGMLDAASKREMAILRRLAEGLEKIGSKIISMNQVFLSEEEIVRITNGEFISVRREDIQGEFDLEVDITTAEINESKAQDLSFMLQTIGNSMEMPMVQMILSEIAELKRMPLLAKRIEDYKPQPNPIAEQMQQLEMQKTQLEIAELESKIQLNQAKARKELSDAEMKDLDFVEQESGTKHLRDMDIRASQAKANQDLEITKRILDQGNRGDPGREVADALLFRTVQEDLTN